MSQQPMVDPDGVRTYDAPTGFVAVLRQSGTCSSVVDDDVKCDLLMTSMCFTLACRGLHRLDRKHVIFLASAANGAMAAATPPLFQPIAQQPPGLKPHEILQNIIDEAEAVKKLREVLIHKSNVYVNAEDAPAGMKAMPATAGCQGCFYLKGKADCTRSSSVSCTELGRKDAQNVIFQPRV